MINTTIGGSGRLDIRENLYFDGVLIYDGVCGVGKTTSAIRLMKLFYEEGMGDNRFIFISPFIMECHRIAGTIPIEIPIEFADDYTGYEISEKSENDADKKMRLDENGDVIYRATETSDLAFKIAEERNGSVLNGLKALIRRKENIASTHSSFKHWDDDVITLLKRHNYHLIIDEAPELIGKVRNFIQNEITLPDINSFIKSGNISVDNDLLKWIPTESIVSLSQYEGFIKLCNNDKALLVGTSQILGRVNPELFRSFKSIRLLTYLFDGSICKAYFDLYEINYQVRDLTFEAQYTVSAPAYHKLVSIHFPKNINPVIKSITEHELSATWYSQKTVKRGKLVPLLNQINASFFKNQTGVSAKEKMWTCYKDYKKEFITKGVSENQFLPCNSRATNIYRHVRIMSYLVNFHLDGNLSSFFASKGIHLDGEKYSLGEMLQWIFRSAIREGKNIRVFIPSIRMRRLLNSWMKSYQEKYIGYYEVYSSDIDKELEELDKTPLTEQEIRFSEELKRRLT
jgi:hypothetical protein